MRNKFNIIVYSVIILAVIGVISQLFTNPASFIKGIFITLGVAAVLIGALYYFFTRKKGSNSTEMKKYKQAVKHSNAKYKENKQMMQKHKPKNNQKSTKQPTQPKKKARKRSHLRVIDGYKDKDKDRASN